MFSIQILLSLRHGHLGLHGLFQPVRLFAGDLVYDGVDLDTEGLDLLVPGIQHLSSLKVNHGVDLVNVPDHPLLGDHPAGDSLCLLWRDLQKQPQTREGDIVVQLGGG